MSLEHVTDIVQLVDLIGFAACLLGTVYVAVRVPGRRPWLILLAVMLAYGTVLYTAIVFHLGSYEARVIMSASLRLYQLTLIAVGLIVHYRIEQHRKP